MRSNRQFMRTGVLLAVVVGSLTGCPKFTKMTMRGECTSAPAGGNCKVSAEATWESRQKMIGSMLAALELVPDAGSYELDTAGSTVPYPSRGGLVVTLTDSTTGAVQAARNFSWIKIGTAIRAEDPDAINAWAYTHAGSADRIAYSLVPFRSSYGAGQQVIAGHSKYEGVTHAEYSVSFEARDCAVHPVTQLCMM